MDALRALAAPALLPAAVLAAVLAPLAVHWLSGRTLVWFDTQRLFAPQRWLVDEALRSFRLPLWDPYMGLGVPVLADTIHGVLHPVSLLTAWLATDRSADLLVGGYVACAGLGGWLLARELGASPLGAAIAALAYANSGFVLSMIGNLVFLAGAGSLPFCVAGLRRFARAPGPASLTFGVGGAAMLALSGDAQALMVGGALGFVLAWEAGGWRGALRAAAAGALGLLVASVQLVPSAANIDRTTRAADTWHATGAVWALEPWRLPELVLPGLLDGPDPYRDPLYAAIAGPGHWPATNYPLPFAASVFVGVVPLILALLGLRAGRRGRALGILAVVLLWIALGPALGADAVLGQVPLWRAFRFSEKLVGPLTLVLAALAGLGLDVAVERRWAGWQLAAGAAALGLASIAAWHLGAARLSPDLASVASARAWRGAAHVLVTALALGGWGLLRDRLGPAAGRTALAALAWGGLAAASPVALHPGDPGARLLAPGPVLDAPPPGPRVMTPYFHDLASTAGTAWLEDAARFQARLAYPAYNVRARLDSLNELAGMTPKQLALLGNGTWSLWPLAARRFGTTHVLLDPPLDEAEQALYALTTRDGTRLGTSPDGIEVWTIPHREWASFATAILAVSGEETALTSTAGAIASESATVVVESTVRLGEASGRVLSVERGLEWVRVEAEADGDGTLVIGDAWWPGWEATLDGVPTTTYRADALVRAVRWPAGRHLLEMRYRPPELRAGLALSALGVILLAVWAVRAVTRRGPGETAQPAPGPREGP
jgi:hypothetical protein